MSDTYYDIDISVPIYSNVDNSLLTSVPMTVLFDSDFKEFWGLEINKKLIGKEKFARWFIDGVYDELYGKGVNLNGYDILVKHPKPLLWSE